MIVDNGYQGRLIIAGVFDGTCGAMGNELSFIPNRAGNRPEVVMGGILDDKPIKLVARKQSGSAFYTATFEYLT